MQELKGDVRLRRLNKLLDEVWRGNAFYAGKWRKAGLHPGELGSIDELSSFPFTGREELVADQKEMPPLGNNLTYFLHQYHRVHRSSGTSGLPLCWPDTPPNWAWLRECSRTLYLLAGVSAFDRLVFLVPFGPSLGAWIMYEGACLLGCLCIPAGAVPADEQLWWLLKFEATVLVGKPGLILSFGDQVRGLGKEPASLRLQKIIAVGEPGGSLPDARGRMKTLWGAEVFDRYGMTEAGSIAGECIAHPGGMHMQESEFIAEVIDPETGEVLPDGEEGELVLTNLGRLGSPIVRYRSGDGVRLVQGRHCACGRGDALLVGGVRRLRPKF
ncbi:MAG: AMP-binding protein [Planctomycetes bacterium]|nr:AMP-binding protein [Planctomycetota bacterium]